MIDINIYRSRIGLFSPKIQNKKFLYRGEYYKQFSWSENKLGKNVLLVINYVMKLVLLLCLLRQDSYIETESYLTTRGPGCKLVSGNYSMISWNMSGRGAAGRCIVCSGVYNLGGGVVDYNFLARYLYGNIQKIKGILNMHLNIRSLQHKVYEVKNLIKQHNPHIFGLSECELKRDKIDEKCLKIPGYNILFPTSWTQHGVARVVVYVRKTFKCQQITELQDDCVQTVWLRGGQNNSKNIFFCHGYREHLSGQGIAAQQGSLNTFLGQWEAATMYGGCSEPNETHVCADMNIDVYQGRWLKSDYHLLSLSKLIKSACDISNFHQLVQEVTRVQFNSVSNTTNMSCLDHIYTNARFRCSDATVTSFGDSDHDIVSYTRYSKNPPIPAIIVCKRSYKKFNSQAFLNEVENTDWSEVYSCNDVDMATECFTRKFRYILNVHAP